MSKIRSRCSALSGGIGMQPPATLNCEMAAAFARWTKDELAPAARWRYFSGVKAIHQGSSYSCRNINGTRTSSEHSHGNALDIMRIELNNGRDIDVRKPGLVRFPPARLPQHRARRRLQLFHHRARPRLQLGPPQPFPFRHQAAPERPPRLPLSGPRADFASRQRRVGSRRHGGPDRAARRSAAERRCGALSAGAGAADGRLSARRLSAAAAAVAWFYDDHSARHRHAHHHAAGHSRATRSMSAWSALGEVLHAFAAAGWDPADRITLKSSVEIGAQRRPRPARPRRAGQHACCSRAAARISPSRSRSAERRPAQPCPLVADRRRCATDGRCGWGRRASTAASASATTPGRSPTISVPTSTPNATW